LGGREGDTSQEGHFSLSQSADWFWPIPISRVGNWDVVLGFLEARRILDAEKVE